MIAYGKKTINRKTRREIDQCRGAEARSEGPFEGFELTSLMSSNFSFYDS